MDLTPVDLVRWSLLAAALWTRRRLYHGFSAAKYGRGLPVLLQGFFRAGWASDLCSIYCSAMVGIS